MDRESLWVEKRRSPASRGNEDPIVSPFRVATILLRRWRPILLFPALAALAAVACTIALNDYTARSRFAPQSSGPALGNMAGLAASFGINVAPGGGGEPIDFYVDLLSSGEILRQALRAEYRFRPDPDGTDVRTGTLLELLDVEGETEERQLRNGVDVLRDLVTAGADARSGLITLDTQAPWGDLAEGINRRMLDLLAEFDRARRQAAARAEREFVETRMDAAKEDLEHAEAGLAGYLDRNRRPYQSPRLTMQLERQQRQVMLKQQVYASLAQAYEEARIEEVRNTPVLTVVDRPEGSARGNRSPLVMGLLALGLTAVLVLGWVFAAETLARGSDSPDFMELRRTWDAVRGRRREESAA